MKWEQSIRFFWVVVTIDVIMTSKNLGAAPCANIISPINRFLTPVCQK